MRSVLMANPELFADTFYDWLQANGVVLTNIKATPFEATIDLNKLKFGVAELIAQYGGSDDGQ